MFGLGSKEKCHCVACALAKAHKRPFKKKRKKAEACIQVWVSDVCGPMKTRTLSGKRYFVLFIDECSRFTHYALLSHKSEVARKFKATVEHVYQEKGKYPSIFHADGGGEYVNKEIED